MKPSFTDRRTLVGIALGVVAVMLAGCHTSDQEVDALNAQLSTLRTKVDEQTRLIEQSQKALIQHDMVVSRFEYTEFDPARMRYFSLNNGVINLMGQVAQVKPLPDGKGSALTLRVANNGSLTVFNPGFMVQWGTAMPTGDKVSPEQIQQWRKELRTSEFRGQMQLIPGNWIEITLSLNGVQPEQLHYLRLTTLMDQVEFGGALAAAPAPASAPATTQGSAPAQQ